MCILYLSCLVLSVPLSPSPSLSLSSSLPPPSLPQLQPPLIPPRGEVNAADAFDIGNFDDDDTRGIKVAEEDQKLYRRFNLVVSDRWQAEMMGRYTHSLVKGLPTV